MWLVNLYLFKTCPRLLLPAKKPSEYGKWAIVTGSTSGIGKAFIEHLSKLNMNVLAISRSEDRLKDQSIAKTYINKINLNQYHAI